MPGSPQATGTAIPSYTSELRGGGASTPRRNRTSNSPLLLSTLVVGISENHRFVPSVVPPSLCSSTLRFRPRVKKKSIALLEKGLPVVADRLNLPRIGVTVKGLMESCCSIRNLLQASPKQPVKVINIRRGIVGDSHRLSATTDLVTNPRPIPHGFPGSDKEAFSSRADCLTK